MNLKQSALIFLLFEILSIALVYFHCTPEQAAQVYMFFSGLIVVSPLVFFYLVTQNGVGPVLKMMFNSTLLPHMVIITTSVSVFHLCRFPNLVTAALGIDKLAAALS